MSQFNYFGPRNFSVFASYYTETLLYSNFRCPLFSRTCQAREIREIKGTQKKRVLQYARTLVLRLIWCMWHVTAALGLMTLTFWTYWLRQTVVPCVSS